MEPQRIVLLGLVVGIAVGPGTGGKARRKGCVYQHVSHDMTMRLGAAIFNISGRFGQRLSDNRAPLLRVTLGPTQVQVTPPGDLLLLARCATET